MRVHTGDVLAVLRATQGLDAVLLDVDNGPRAMTQAANCALYTNAGVVACVRALAPGGVLAVWSANDDEAYRARLRRAGLTVELHRPSAHGTRGPRHVVFTGRKP